MMQNLVRRLCVVAIASLLLSCSQPMGANRVTQDQALQDISGTILTSDEVSSQTRFQLHRYGLDQLFAADPDGALRQLQAKAIATNDRDLLFALAETSYSVAKSLTSRTTLRTDTRLSTPKRPPGRDPRDYYLGAAIYAYLFLFSPAHGELTAFDRRFRTACEIYNFSLGWALTEPHDAKGVIQLAPGLRRLPVGDIRLTFTLKAPTWEADTFVEFRMADQYRISGMSSRNRQSGVGAPLIAVPRLDPNLSVSRSVPATILLRVDGTLADVAAGTQPGALELYATNGTDTVTIGNQQVPLEKDTSITMAYTLNQETVWNIGWLRFFSADQAPNNHLIMPGHSQPGLIPVVLVHGTFSSPVWWVEMLNTLAADPMLRTRFQFWAYMYSSSNPILISGADFRDELTTTVRRLDPSGQDEALKHMVIIGHSQGGLLAKLTATHTGDALWKSIFDQPMADLHLNETDSADFSRLFFVEPLPFVTRTVFIATPHRGSYQNGSLLRRSSHWLVTLPAKVVDKTTVLLSRSKESKLTEFLDGNVATSLDGMSPNNPLMLALAEIPLAPGVTGHSIIAVTEDADDIPSGNDGVVTYQSAHVNYVESELVVRQGHSCQDKPETIEEVRRILHRHLTDYDRAHAPKK